MISLERLKPYHRSLLKNDRAVKRMMESIREYGFKIPILARSGGEVVDGHLRLKAAKRLGLIEVPVIWCDEWTPAQVQAFRLLVNRSASWAEWDDSLLALEFAELSAVNFDLDLTGFDPAKWTGCWHSRPDHKIANRNYHRSRSVKLETRGFVTSIACSAATARRP